MNKLQNITSNVVALCLLTTMLCSAAGNTEPLSNVPAERREELRRRVNEYVKAYGANKWDSLYDFVSDIGKGHVDRPTFIAAMKAEHGSNFAQMPDLVGFKLERADKNNDGFDIYGCGSAKREGVIFNGIAVMHGVFEHDSWFFTGWTFTDVPNVPCKRLVDPNWKPDNTWNRPMEEVENYRLRTMSHEHAS